MMFLVRRRGRAPSVPGIEIKCRRRTPALVAGGAETTDYFCVGEVETVANGELEGSTIIHLHDGWYADDTGGGVAIWGQGKYWEVRDTPFTVCEASGPEDVPVAAEAPDLVAVNVRGAIFGA